QMLADELQLTVHTHLHETKTEVLESIGEHGKSPLQRFNDLGLLTPRLLAVHMTQLDSDDIELIADTGINILHCPKSNMKLGSGICPVADLIDAGTNVALGTDSAASNNKLDMLDELKTAALLAKVATTDATVIPAFTALEMATINGAIALNIEDKLGSIASGKQADLVALNLNTASTIPVHDPISTLVYSASAADVREVWVAGKRRVKDGELSDVNLSAIQTKANQWRDKLASTV
ncbi:MAG: amidohydrolase family protein, partial [Pseudomonadota bacterium]